MKSSIPFDQLTSVIVQQEFDRYKSGHSRGMVFIGKLLAWCHAFKQDKSLSAYVRERFGFKIPRQSFACAKLFRILKGRSWKAITEAQYDLLSRQRAIALSSKAANMTDSEIAEYVRQCLLVQPEPAGDQQHPVKRGYIYAMVSSADPDVTKLGRTRLDPRDRAEDIGRQTGSPARIVVAWHDLVDDCVAAERELKKRFASARIEGRKEWYRVGARDAIIAIQSIAAALSAPEEKPIPTLQPNATQAPSNEMEQEPKLCAGIFFEESMEKRIEAAIRELLAKYSPPSEN